MEQAGVERMSRMDQLRQEIADTIANSREDVQNEVKTSENSWFRCFVTRLASIRLSLELGAADGIISEDRYRELAVEIESLDKKVKELDRNKPGTKAVDDTLENELFSELEAIGEGL